MHQAIAVSLADLAAQIHGQLPDTARGPVLRIAGRYHQGALGTLRMDKIAKPETDADR